MVDDSRAFRENLTGEPIYNAQRRLLCALLRQPGLRPPVVGTGIVAEDFDKSLRRAFNIAVASTGDVDRTDPEISALTNIGVTLAPGQAVSLAMQILESHRRARDARDASFRIRALTHESVPPQFVDATRRRRGCGGLTWVFLILLPHSPQP